MLLPAAVWGQQKPPLLGDDPEEKTHPCDWKRAAGILTDTELRLWIECYEKVNLDKGAAFTVFLDTDQNSMTGFAGPGGTKPVGAEYMLQGGTVYRYDGTGSEWYWSEIGNGIGNAGNKIWEIRIKVELIGGEHDAIDFFCFGDNEAPGVDGKGLDLFPDGAYEDGDRMTLKKIVSP